jgi:hypothetical protein
VFYKSDTRKALDTDAERSGHDAERHRAESVATRPVACKEIDYLARARTHLAECKKQKEESRAHLHGYAVVAVALRTVPR